MLRTFSWLAAGCAALWISAASALGLGEIDVKSKLNQRFLATIPMTSVSADEAETVIVSLANNEDFARAGIERTEYLTSLRFAVNTEGGNPRIVVSSPNSAREPFLSFLLEVRSKSGRNLREYTVLLDPPDLVVAPPKPAPAQTTAATTEFYETPEEQARRSSTAPTAPVKKPAAAPSPPQPVIATPVPQPAPTPVPEEPSYSSTPDRYGPVQARETLWSIAAKLRPDATISMDQVLLALYKSNPKAFDGFQGLRKGSVLNVPSSDEMRETSATAAKARVAQLRGTPRAVAPSLPPVEPVVPAYVPPPPPPPAPVAAKPVEKVKPLPPIPAQPVAPPKAEKPLLPPTPAPAPAPVEKKPEPVSPPPAAVVSAPPPVVTTPPPAEVVPPPAAEQPLVAEQPLIPETPPAAVIQPPAPIEPVVPPADAPSDNSGLYLWLVVGLVLLGAGGFLGWRFWKGQQGEDGEPRSFIPSAVTRRKASAEAMTAAAAPKAASRPNKPVAAPAQVNEPSFDSLEDTLAQTGQLGGDTGQFSNSSFDATSESPASRFDSTQAMSTGQSYNANATLSMDAPTSRTSHSISPSPSERVDFDVTSQFAAETMSINLDANDPVSEADFHLAYGLYDEAALLLKQAAEKEPGRTDVRVKLAETYFAASRPAEFQQVAESLQGQLPNAEWQKLAIMGMQLCPDAAVFADAGDAAALGGGDIDLSFDEPAEFESSSVSESTVAMPAMDFSLDPAPVRSSAPSIEPAQDIGGLDFKLEELELPKLDEPRFEMPSSSGSNSLDFKLSDINLNATSPGTSEIGKSNSLNFEITNSMQTVAMSAGGDEDVRLDDFDLNEASSAISTGDEAGTKLDLARAYADMGDNDMARTLLKEVLEQGNNQQQQEAQSLMGRLA